MLRTSRLCVLALTMSTLAAANAVAAPTAKEAPVKTFLSDLCQAVAQDGDEDGTDSGSEYASSCFSDQEAKLDQGLSAKQVVGELCRASAQYSADLKELADESLTVAQTKALTHGHIVNCFSAAKKFAAQDGVVL